MLIPENKILLKIRNLSLCSQSKTGQPIIDNLNFEIEKSRITALAGESGAGKTLLALCICGLAGYVKGITVSGSIFFTSNDTSQDILSLNENELTKLRGNKIAIVLQDPLTYFDPNMKIKNQISEIVEIHKLQISESDLNILLQKAELDIRVLESYPHQLSGGELQRLAFVSASLPKPKLLIFDEPTTNLDKKLTRQMLDMIRNFCISEDITVLFISHDLKAVRYIADNVCIMKNGRIIEYNTCKKVFENPENEHTKKLIDSFFNFNPISRPNYTSESAIEVNSVSKTFKLNDEFDFFRKRKYLKVLDKVDFVLSKAEVIGIIGHSGSGKSTLARILVQLEIADNGNVTIEEKVFSLSNNRDSGFLRKNIQLVFQNPITSLNRIIKIRTLLAEPLKSEFRKSKVKSYEILKILRNKLGIKEELLCRYPDQISGGEAQRIALARALTNDPKILILDESFSALDRISQNEIMNILNKIISEKDIAIIIITHDIDIAAKFCDKLIILKKGTIVESGNTKEIINSPKNEFTKSLINADY
jgi:ABC-type glutathione transport system ATPase component